MKQKKRVALKPTHVILASFLAVIFVGSLLLALPISTVSREGVPYIDALFTATTATCVTGLVTVPTATTWSVFGQAVILQLNIKMLLAENVGKLPCRTAALVKISAHQKLGNMPCKASGKCY